MKCWQVTIKGEDPMEYSDLVHAETPGKAKRQAYFSNDVDFTRLRVRRVKVLDNKELSPKNVLQAGYGMFCSYLNCDDIVFKVEYLVNDNPYCEKHKHLIKE